MRLTRLNHDSSWLVELHGTRILLDPWLLGPSVVAVPFVHRAVLGQPTVPVEALPAADAILLSHPYPDHTNAATLRHLDRRLPVLAGPIALALARLLGGFTNGVRLGDRSFGGAATPFGRVSISYCRAGRFDPTHNVYLLRGLDSGESLLYCPHSMFPTGPAMDAVVADSGGKVDVLLTAFDLLDLPFYLGGIAKLGQEASVALVERFRPSLVLRTHDGEKPDTGFISRVQRWVYCTDVPRLLGTGVRYAEPPLAVPLDTRAA